MNNDTEKKLDQLLADMPKTAYDLDGWLQEDETATFNRIVRQRRLQAARRWMTAAACLIIMISLGTTLWQTLQPLPSLVDHRKEVAVVEPQPSLADHRKEVAVVQPQPSLADHRKEVAVVQPQSSLADHRAEEATGEQSDGGVQPKGVSKAISTPLQGRGAAAQEESQELVAETSPTPDTPTPEATETASIVPPERQALADIYLAEAALQVAYRRQAQAEALRAYTVSFEEEEAAPAQTIIAF